MQSETADFSCNDFGKTISLTAKAVEMVKKAIEQENLEGHGLRVAVKGGGCSGLQYSLDFAKELRMGDIAFEIDGISMFIDFASEHFLRGTEIDYLSGLDGAGFKFNNPNPIRRTCGCGHLRS